MEPKDYLEAIRENATAMVDAAAAAGIDAPVPSCPKWIVADLLKHIGGVHRWAAMSCQREPSGEFIPSSRSGIEIPEPAARPDWVREGAELLADVLGSRPADSPCWTWAPPSTVGFWQRRQAHETAMHRVDAQLAAGGATPIDAALAADGIDEWLELVGNRPWLDHQIDGAGETIHVHCTDVAGEWLIRLAPAGLEVERAHAKGDVAARGAASDLLCWMQGRGPIDALEVHGDESLLSRWREVATF